MIGIAVLPGEGIGKKVRAEADRLAAALGAALAAGARIAGIAPPGEAAPGSRAMADAAVAAPDAPLRAGPLASARGLS